MSWQSALVFWFMALIVVLAVVSWLIDLWNTSVRRRRAQVADHWPHVPYALRDRK